MFSFFDLIAITIVIVIVNEAFFCPDRTEMFLVSVSNITIHERSEFLFSSLAHPISHACPT